MSSSKNQPESSISGVLKHRSRILGLYQNRYYWLCGNILKLSKTSNINELSKEIVISPSTNIYIREDKKRPELLIDCDDGPYNLSGPMKEILPLYYALRDLKEPNDMKQLSKDNFRILSVLGKGFYGKVFLVQKIDSGDLYALKVIRKKKLIELDSLSTIVAERSLPLSIPSHPFIVSLCFAFQTQYKFYLGLEYAAGGQLLQYLKQFAVIPIEDIRLYIAEITLALQHLHDNGIIYRDLKPENVLLDITGHIKITDFGLSKNVGQNDGTTSTFCGTYEYMAPEIVQHIEYDYKIDIWSLGCLFYEILFGISPFYDEAQEKIFQNILHKEPDFPKFGHRSAMALMKLLLSKNPEERPTFEQIKSDPFFRGLNWESVIKKQVQPPHFKENFLGAPNSSDESPVDSEVASKEISLRISNFSFGFD